MDQTNQKINDYQNESYVIRTVKDCDNGYSLTFDGTDLSYWISKKYNFIPKPNDMARIYGELKGSIKEVETRTGKVRYKETDNAAVRGMDIIRTTIDIGTREEVRKKVELFYEPRQMQASETAKDQIPPKKTIDPIPTGTKK